jgi:hypothetical protein
MFVALVVLLTKEVRILGTTLDMMKDIPGWESKSIQNEDESGDGPIFS